MAEFIVKERRRVVLRIVHELDADGCVIGLHLEPFLAAKLDDIAWAAWQASQRRHPWIIGDAESAQLESQRRIAINQVRNLLTTADETLLAIAAAETIEDLRCAGKIEQLRNAATDLRGYMGALQGKVIEEPELNRRITRAG